PVRPSGDVALCDPRGKTVGVPHNPVGEQAAAASTGYTQFLLVDAASPNDFVDTRHQVFEIVARVFVLDDVSERLAVARAPARVWIEHDVTLGRHPLELGFKDVAVSRVRPAMDVENERIFFRRVESRWLL